MKFLPSSVETMTTFDVLPDGEWFRVQLEDIRPNDRILVVRMSSGVRTISESVVSHFDYSTSTWRNSMGSPVLSTLDTNVFRFGEPPDDQSTEYDDIVLGH